MKHKLVFRELGLWRQTQRDVNWTLNIFIGRNAYDNVICKCRPIFPQASICEGLLKQSIPILFQSQSIGNGWYIGGNSPYKPALPDLSAKVEAKKNKDNFCPCAKEYEEVCLMIIFITVRRHNSPQLNCLFSITAKYNQRPVLLGLCEEKPQWGLLCGKNFLVITWSF